VKIVKKGKGIFDINICLSTFYNNNTKFIEYDLKTFIERKVFDWQVYSYRQFIHLQTKKRLL
jgi:hypothetical protein